LKKVDKQSLLSGFVQDIVGLVDVSLEFRRVVNEINETLEVSGVHGEEHTSDLAVAVGVFGEHGVEEVVADGSLGLAGFHGREGLLGGEGSACDRGSLRGDIDGSGSGVGDLAVSHVTGALRAARARGTSGSVRSTGTARTTGALVHGATLVVVGEGHGRVQHLLLLMLLHGLLRRDAGHTNVTWLEERDVQGLGEALDGVVGRIGNRLLRRIGRRKADITEATGGHRRHQPQERPR